MVEQSENENRKKTCLHYSVIFRRLSPQEVLCHATTSDCCIRGIQKYLLFQYSALRDLKINFHLHLHFLKVIKLKFTWRYQGQLTSNYF